MGLLEQTSKIDNETESNYMGKYTFFYGIVKKRIHAFI